MRPTAEENVSLLGLRCAGFRKERLYGASQPLTWLADLRWNKREMFCCISAESQNLSVHFQWLQTMGREATRIINDTNKAKGCELARTIAFLKRVLKSRTYTIEPIGNLNNMRLSQKRWDSEVLNTFQCSHNNNSCDFFLFFFFNKSS